MARKVGWAEPKLVITQPRIQMVDGFHYFYVEERHIKENEAGACLRRLVPKLEAAFLNGFGKAPLPPLLVMFIDEGFQKGTYVYHVQAGYSVRSGTQPLGEALVRIVPPTLVASMLVWGARRSVVHTYGPLVEFMKSNGYKDIVGWREWYLYNESGRSSNNISWIQHEVEEVS